MQKINLRELYPDIYKTDTFLEVTDEVQAVFLADKRAEARYLRQMYNYKAHYSLDCDNGIEKALMQHPPTPEEILEDKQLRDQLYKAHRYASQCGWQEHHRTEGPNENKVQLPDIAFGPAI